jgi:membrane-associated phospholipid phosphatase
MRFLFNAALFPLLTYHMFFMFSDEYKIIEILGDIGQVASPFYAAVCSIGHKDWKGVFYLAIILVINQISVEIIKIVIVSIRPNGFLGSFPSGHTAAAFLGAGFIMKRYEKRESLPALMVAILVGFRRVYNQAHWISDVFGGATLGLSLCLPIPSKKIDLQKRASHDK